MPIRAAAITSHVHSALLDHFRAAQFVIFIFTLCISVEGSLHAEFIAVASAPPSDNGAFELLLDQVVHVSLHSAVSSYLLSSSD